MLRSLLFGRALSFSINSCQLPASTAFPALSRCVSLAVCTKHNKNNNNGLAGNTFPESKTFLNGEVFSAFQTQVRHYAARKGTRERREKLKKKRKREKIEIPKLSFYQRLKLSKEEGTVYVKQRPKVFPERGFPVDDVYFYHKYNDKEWTFAEAVQCHRETHHPTIYNKPNCPLLLRIHLNMQYPNRPKKCQDGWRSVVEMKQPFLLPGMSTPTVLAFCPNDPELIQEAIEAGADLAGSSDLIKDIQAGVVNIADYEYVVCHPLVITELTAIRGLMKRKFPMVKTRTLDVDIAGMVTRYKAGMKIQACTTEREPGYGWIEAPLGTLDMDIDGMEANFESILADTLPHRLPGRTAEEFILGCNLKTAFTFEKIKLEARPYILKHDKRPATTASQTDESGVEEPADSEDKAQKASS